MKNILTSVFCIALFTLSGCYDEFDKTEAFEPFTQLTFSPVDGDFNGATEIIVEINAPGLETATATAIGGSDPIDLGAVTFSNGTATLSVPVSSLNGADRINFTANNTDGRPFTTRYSIEY